VKARQNTTSTTSSRTAAIAVLILAFVLGFFVLASQAEGHDEPVTKPTQTTAVDQAPIRAEYNKAVRYQHLADVWAHRRGDHNRFAHRPLVQTHSYVYEKNRATSWFNAMLKEKAKTQLYEREVKAAINSCVRAGAPRDICRVFREATGDARVPTSWAHDPALLWVVKHESGFRPHAQNPGSTAYGLFQFLDSTWGGTGVSKTADAHWQTVAGYRYIKNRYHTPTAAKNFKLANGWY